MTCSDELLSSRLPMQTCLGEREREKERKKRKEKKERQRAREREKAVKRPVLASAGISFMQENVKQAAKVLSGQNLDDGRFQLSPPPEVAPNELVECVF